MFSHQAGKTLCVSLIACLLHLRHRVQDALAECVRLDGSDGTLRIVPCAHCVSCLAQGRMDELSHGSRVRQLGRQLGMTNDGC
jgi:hypothetical protein